MHVVQAATKIVKMVQCSYQNVFMNPNLNFIKGISSLKNNESRLRFITYITNIFVSDLIVMSYVYLSFDELIFQNGLYIQINSVSNKIFINLVIRGYRLKNLSP